MQLDYEEKILRYHELLVKWQRALNLVSPATISDARKRHFEDSLQVADLIPASARSLADLGSGAGFPGLVLAVARPGMEVHLIESDDRKCEFMRSVSRETLTPVIIHNARIEDVDIQVDVITARALAPLAKLLGMAQRFYTANPQATGLFMKGRTSREEIELARKEWAFKCRQHPSKTEKDAYILEITDLRGL